MMLKRLLPLISSAMLVLAVWMPTHADAADEFCWKSTQTRGAGTIPEYCTDSSRPSKEVGMCYQRCKDGWEGAATMCLRTCPSGYTNTGLTCHISKELLVPASVDVCSMRTTCPSGYTNAGLLCGLTTPSVPQGYEEAVPGISKGLDLSRQGYDRGIGNAPQGCPGGKVNDAGLCYPTCPANFTGVGPVCWGQCPSGWVNCGASCGKTAAACTETIAGQVTSVGSVAASIATLGTSSKLTGAQKTTELQKKLQQIKDLKKKYETQLLLMDLAHKEYQATKNTIELSNAMLEPGTTDEELYRLSLELVSIADPTGLVGAAASFVYPTCDKIKN
jgi:hypothetical protein